MFIAKLPGVSGVFRIMLMAVMLAVSAGCQNLASDDAKVVSQLKSGSIITFGRYPQTESGEIKPIEWRVLEVKDNKALLLADKGLDAVPYNTKFAEVTWKTSSIRQWLNVDFYNAAFNESEKSRIAVTDLKNHDNPEFGTKGGGDTRDRIFLLSIDEVNQYFIHDAERALKPTPYAVKRGTYAVEKFQSSSTWWLRSPGRDQYYASHVYANGILYQHGRFVSLDYHAARPALWIEL